MQVAIFDYGAGNIFSLKVALEKLGAQVDVITSFDGKNNYSGILLPGVGNFDPAIRSIREYSRTKFEDYAKDTPVLGICLGMEMFFEKSEEGKENGLAVMEGEVVMLPDKFKIPHMGWNSLKIKKQSPLLDGVPDLSWVYFVHSYRVKPKDDDIIVADADYGIEVPAVVNKKNLFGTQFHPEKSGKVGSTMIENFLRVCKK
ncbi:imidazole glycerol phosphate synthase subunit HisH [Candidatus Nitrosotenuis uzonensis]|uniref:Imidazole glycerol phosphate synthase subunit HisH n=1 Tax=Candidatus Nitrosotenuis uzonensis TaxID=1407055 RepID=A0A812ETW8_9ARCH|nr:imidazole glycerol phosphate synthase subunit HisH [Candidatus Nitrosotenuis uzonensis]CAE6487169.1 Imidazole glycerol phosphate synthase subunit HisH [Candidatus Nitrosotenuis uzonensis]